MAVLKQLDEGVDLAFFDESCNSIKTKLEGFSKNGFSDSMLILGPTGCGKTYTVNRAIRETELNDVTIINIDCQIYDNDTIASKEFLRQAGSLNAPTLHDSMRKLGSVILIFDHFDSFKMIKKQHFLYQVFDSIHQGSISLLAILIVSSVTPLSNLEKRVRSRLSPIYLEFPSSTSLTIFKKNGKTGSLFDFSQTVNKNSLIIEAMNELQDTNSILFKKAQQIYQVFPNLRMIFNFLKKLVLISPNHHIDLSKAEDIFQELFSFSSIYSIIDSCSQLELTILLIAQYIVNMNNYNCFSFDELFNQFKQQLVSSMYVKKITEDQAKVACNCLISKKLLLPLDNNQNKFLLAVFSSNLKPFIKRVPTEVSQWANSKLA